MEQLKAEQLLAEKVGSISVFKDRGVETESITISDFIERIIRFTKNDPEITAQVKTIVVNAILENPKQIDYCLFSNHVGQKLLSAELPNLATECFEFSFEEESPYSINQAIYAANFITALKRYCSKLGTVIDPEAAAWLKGKKRSLGETSQCVTHFKNHIIYQEAHNNGKGANGNVNFTQPGLDQANLLQIAENDSASLLQTINLL